MTKTFGSLDFTPAVKALQERYGSRRRLTRRHARAHVVQDGLEIDR
jgi:hypothetical protein